MKQILKVLAGSQAHGLATPESDYDYRGVFVVPTADILRIGTKTNSTNWIEGKVDDTSWEIGHFLKLATSCNPTILETFLAPYAKIECKRIGGCMKELFGPKSSCLCDDKSFEGEELRALFPHVWNSTDVMNAFVGYGINQRKKFLDNKEGRQDKYAAAYARSLYNAFELLSTGTFTIRIGDLPVGKQILDFKNGKYRIGEVIDFCHDLELKVKSAYEDNPNKKTDMEPVNELLLKIRKNNW